MITLTKRIDKKTKNYILEFYFSHSTTQNLAHLNHEGSKENLMRRISIKKERIKKRERKKEFLRFYF